MVPTSEQRTVQTVGSSRRWKVVAKTALQNVVMKDQRMIYQMVYPMEDQKAILVCSLMVLLTALMMGQMMELRMVQLMAAAIGGAELGK